MSGTLIFKPMEAKLTHDLDLFSKMDPYCEILLSDQTAIGKVCKSGGKHPTWTDENLTVIRKGEPVCFIEIKDHNKYSADGIIGVVKIDLNTLPTGATAQWHPVYFAKQKAGELLVEIIWTPDANQSEEHHHHHHHSHEHYGEN